MIALSVRTRPDGGTARETRKEGGEGVRRPAEGWQRGKREGGGIQACALVAAFHEVHSDLHFSLLREGHNNAVTLF